MAASRGWKSIVLWGPPPFVELAIRHAIASGIVVNPTNSAQQEMLDAILSESTGGGGAGPALEPSISPPSPFGEEIAKKLAARREEEEQEQRRFSSNRRSGGHAP